MKKPEDITEKIMLKDIIRKVQTELILSQEEREKNGIDPLFEVENLEIELNFVAERSGEKNGNINLSIISGELIKNYRTEQIQRIKISLKTVKKQKEIEEENPFKKLDGSLPDKEVKDNTTP